ncbi:hypothetical protein HOLleu_39512 [Holothuria leucospilota]|uniref:Uncharacterized protein n=1 Tax=Holothuria leucospilota TaxID=206669 RepID=A0A9Q0YIP7_HOLLE|nr:hypothetical protein HOLleu_39512 [Holothuria leucospilota]
MIVEARVKNFQKEFAGEVGIIRPSVELLEKKGVLVARCLLRLGAGNLPVRLANFSDQAVTVYKDTTFGVCEGVEEVISSRTGEGDIAKDPGAVPVLAPGHQEDWRGQYSNKEKEGRLTHIEGTESQKVVCAGVTLKNEDILDESAAKMTPKAPSWTSEELIAHQGDDPDLERKWDVQRHEIGCKRRSRTVTTETVGEWDVSPGGTKTDVKGKRPSRGENQEDGYKRGVDLRGVRESREKESNERSEGKNEKEQKEPVPNTDEEEEEKAGEKRKVQEAQGSCKRRVLKGGLKSLDPPLVQRVPTLAYLTALGSPIEKPKTPKQETQGSEREKGEKVTKEEESGMVARADMKEREDRVSYEIDVGPGTVWRKIVRKTHHVDGRVTIEEKEEILRVCDCKNVQKN